MPSLEQLSKWSLLFAPIIGLVLAYTVFSPVGYEFDSRMETIQDLALYAMLLGVAAHVLPYVRDIDRNDFFSAQSAGRRIGFVRGSTYVVVCFLPLIPFVAFDWRLPEALYP